MRAADRLVVGVVIAGGLLRAGRLPARWDEIALAYAAYTEPVVQAMRAGAWESAVGTWVGLHPPLYAALLGAVEAISTHPVVALALSALLSLAAVVAVGRVGGALAAAVLASAPIQMLYCAELNNYPLAAFAVAAVLAAAKAPWPWLALAAVAAGWSHLLAGAAGAAVLGWRLVISSTRERACLIGAVALGWAPLVAGVLRRISLETTWSQGGVGDGGPWLRAAAEAVGPEGLALGLLAILGMRGPAGLAALGVGGALAASLVLGAAAPHQLPYLVLLGPPAALGVATAARHPGVKAAVVALCLLRAGRVALAEGRVLAELVADLERERAVDAAIRESRPGDALWLVSPALEPDDDKDATSGVLWRFPPWDSMPRLRPFAHEYTDPRFGQPRVWRGRTVLSSTDLDAGAFDAVAGGVLGAGGRVWVVLYDEDPAPGLVPAVARVLRPYQVQASRVGDAGPLGQDWLYRVDGRAW